MHAGFIMRTIAILHYCEMYNTLLTEILKIYNRVKNKSLFLVNQVLDLSTVIFLFLPLLPAFVATSLLSLLSV